MLYYHTCQLFITFTTAHFKMLYHAIFIICVGYLDHWRAEFITYSLITDYYSWKH